MAAQRGEPHWEVKAGQLKRGRAGVPLGEEGMKWGALPVQTDKQELSGCGGRETDEPNHHEVCRASACCPCCAISRGSHPLGCQQDRCLGLAPVPFPFPQPAESVSVWNRKRLRPSSPHPHLSLPSQLWVTASTFPF